MIYVIVAQEWDHTKLLGATLDFDEAIDIAKRGKGYIDYDTYMYVFNAARPTAAAPVNLDAFRKVDVT